MSFIDSDILLTKLVGRGLKLELRTELSPSGRYWVVKEDNDAGEAWYRIMAPGWFSARYFKAWHSSEYGWTRFIPTFETADDAESWLEAERAHWESSDKRSKVRSCNRSHDPKSSVIDKFAEEFSESVSPSYSRSAITRSSNDTGTDGVNWRERVVMLEAAIRKLLDGVNARYPNKKSKRVDMP